MKKGRKGGLWRQGAIAALYAGAFILCGVTARSFAAESTELERWQELKKRIAENTIERPQEVPPSRASAAKGAPDTSQKRSYAPKKIAIDTDHDGIINNIEYYSEKGEIDHIESDMNRDGIPDEWIYYKGWQPVKKAQDTNGDGQPDLWVDY